MVRAHSDRIQEVVYTTILAPTGADEWVYDRQQLWNAVERSVLKLDGTTRKQRTSKEGKILDEGAQLYRECEISIPREVWDQDRALAVRTIEDFTTENFVSDGMVADIAIHDSEAADGKRNVHAHIMLTMRRLETDEKRIDAGYFFKANREREWDCPEDLTKQISYAKKCRATAEKQWDKTEDIKYRDEARQWADKREKLDRLRPVNRIRTAWEAAANNALAGIGSQARIDHRTLQAQRAEAMQQGDLVRAAELDREPLPRLSPIAKHIKQKAGVIADRANVYWGSKARQDMWNMAKALTSLDGNERAKVFLRVTDVMQDFLDEWRDSRDERVMLPTVRLDKDFDR